MHNPQLFTHFIAWKNLFKHLKRPPKNNYHKFRCADEVEIKEWWLYRLPNYVSIIKRSNTASGMLTIPNNNVASRSEGANNITIESNGIGPSINIPCLFQHSTLLWIFFCKLYITKGCKQKNYKIYNNSNISHIKACGRLMCK
jgi:hypothetical protein